VKVSGRVIVVERLLSNFSAILTRTS